MSSTVFWEPLFFFFKGGSTSVKFPRTSQKTRTEEIVHNTHMDWIKDSVLKKKNEKKTTNDITGEASLTTSTMTYPRFPLSCLHSLCVVCTVRVSVHASMDAVICEGMKYCRRYCRSCVSVNGPGGAPICFNLSSVCSSHFVALQVRVRRYGPCREGGDSILTLTVKEKKSTGLKKKKKGDIFKRVECKYLQMQNVKLRDC